MPKYSLIDKEASSEEILDISNDEIDGNDCSEMNHEAMSPYFGSTAVK